MQGAVEALMNMIYTKKHTNEKKVDTRIMRVVSNIRSIGYAAVNQILILEYIGLMLGENKPKMFAIKDFQISHIINCPCTCCL